MRHASLIDGGKVCRCRVGKMRGAKRWAKLSHGLNAPLKRHKEQRRWICFLQTPMSSIVGSTSDGRRQSKDASLGVFRGSSQRDPSNSLGSVCGDRQEIGRYRGQLDLRVC